MTITKYFQGIDLLNGLRGTYVLVYKLRSPLTITTVKFKWLLEPNLFLYFGSAKGQGSTSLANRIKRHTNPDKKLFWHIDYLTSSLKGELSEVWYSTQESLSECDSLQQFVKTFIDAKIIPRFGSSDCKKNCGGHLVQVNFDSAPDIDKYFKSRFWRKIE